MDTTAAASTLTRQRISVAVLSLAATATLGYFCYRVWNPPLPEPPPDRRLHRSNAVRHRRRSLPNVVHGHSREPSEDSTTSVESHADENIDVNTVRPLNDAETVADEHEHTLEDNWYDDPNNQFGSQQQPQQRAGQNIVSLLFRVSEDNARRNAYVHRGCMCNGCGITPIRGIRYRCSNCYDFDLCEICESQGLHTKTHVFYKIRVPIPRLAVRQLQPVWYPGDPDNCLRLLPKHLMAKLSKETGFERPELEALWEQWTFMANTEWREDPDELGLAMDRKTFERYLVPSGGYRHIAPNLLHDRMFAFYDDNNDDLIGFSEFLRGTAYRKRKDRLRKIFNGYDADGDGYINRRDCLRLFRAYYVLFKHLQRDVLDVLVDQVVSSTEVEQLVTSRQPLSSMFGREGGFPHADIDRPMEGKVTNLNTGEVHITDGATTVVNKDAPDTADRQSILTSVFNRQAHVAQSLFIPVTDNPQPAGERTSGLEYLNGLLNPPTRLSEIPALLVGEMRDGEDFFLVVNGGRGGQDGSSDENRASSQSEGNRVDNHTVTNGYSDGEAPDESEPRRPAYRSPTSSRRMRQHARRKLFDRWKRRQFYLDEEEGVLPPADWSDDDDILATLNGPVDDSKTTQPPLLSSRSRSSSKVRFAEDTDDFDIRSNPSTSSRSVPERWGGMEIPDAERDVGKEIFYQVIQQAFNEILDTIFAAKEDLAVDAAETKDLRDKYRHLFESLDPNEGKAPRENRDSTSRKPKSPRFQALQKLLESSGYTIDAATSQAEAENETGEEAEVEEEDGETSADEDDDSPPALITISDDGTSVEPVAGDVNAFSDDSPKEGAIEFQAGHLAESISPQQEYRDPTMPQFRPNSTSVAISVVCEIVPEQGPSETTAADSTINGKEPEPHRWKQAEKPPKSAEGKSENSSRSIPRSTLLRWKRLDLAEEEAKARGGWGRLSYEEFERIYKAAEARGTRLDYLGTWIDFCIPST
jgi:Ca2+-binding EF-hand superfamily protein